MNQKKFISLITKSLGVKSKKISMSLKFNDIDEWDSIGHLNILSALDKITNGKSSKIKQLGTQTSLKKIWALLKKNKLVI